MNNRVNRTDILTELPVHDNELEKTVLHVLTRSTEVQNYVRRLNENDFYNLLYKDVFNAINEYIAMNGTFNFFNLPTNLKENIEVKNIYNLEYVLYSQADFYIATLKEITAKRELQYLSNSINVMVKEDRNVFDIRAKIEQKVEEVSQYGIAIMSAQNKDIEEEFLAHLGQKATPLHTGYKQLDKTLGGLFAGHFVLIGGIPGVGKTTMMLNMMNHICGLGKKVLFVSLEMPYSETHAKLVSINSKIPLSIIRGVEKTEDYSAIFNGVASISDYRLFRIGASGCRVYDIENEIKRLNGVDAVFIDYLQRLTPNNRNASRYEQVSEMSRDVKMLANKFKIPVISVASINRGYEGRNDHRPRLADFRDSGSVEFDIDVGLLLYRPAMFPNPNMSNEEFIKLFDDCEMLIVKNRYGATGDIIHYRFIPEESRFEENA